MQMKDTLKIEVVKMTTTKDTIAYSVDKGIVNHFIKEKSIDTFQILAFVLPIIASLLTLLIKGWLDNINEEKKYTRELNKESRRQRQAFLKLVNKLQATFRKSNDPAANYDDIVLNTANFVVGLNPFENMYVNANLYFTDQEIISLIEEMYLNAETINRLFDWDKKEHGQESVKLGEKILEDIEILRTKIAETLKN
jgi:hypothetical protein